METNFPNLSLPHARRARSRVASDLRALARDADRLIEALGEDIGDKTRSARARFGDAYDSMKERYSDWQDRGIATARKAASRVDDSVRESPYIALGVGFGAGLVLGWLLTSRRD
jgi:ElaB/YqjD/DUF883 family membrane-anchored ribosome-binding protein